MRYSAIVLLVLLACCAPVKGQYQFVTTYRVPDSCSITSIDLDTIFAGDTCVAWKPSPRLDSLIVFYVDTVAWKQVTETEWINPPGDGAHYTILAFAEVTRWVPITETTYVASYPIESKKKRDCWQYRIR